MMKSAKKTTPAEATPPENYEAALAELEGLVSQLERGDLPLQGAFDAYQRGFQLLQYCQAQLQSLDEQVQIFDDSQQKTVDNPTK